jgi:hypothetical protein
MLSFAERRAQDAGLEHVEFIERDFEMVEDLGPERFDAVVR